jgi:hypothetical protein
MINPAQKLILELMEWDPKMPPKVPLWLNDNPDKWQAVWYGRMDPGPLLRSLADQGAYNGDTLYILTHEAYIPVITEEAVSNWRPGGSTVKYGPSARQWLGGSSSPDPAVLVFWW